MNGQITLKIVLENPPPGVDFGVQKGSGTNYETVQTQRSGNKDLVFAFSITIKPNKDGSPNFLGPFVHGTPGNRFIYIDIGTAAGQIAAIWTRRLKIPLRGITASMIQTQLADSTIVLETKVPGTGKDMGPTCGTVKPFNGWDLCQRNVGP